MTAQQIQFSKEVNPYYLGDRERCDAPVFGLHEFRTPYAIEVHNVLNTHRRPEPFPAYEREIVEGSMVITVIVNGEQRKATRDNARWITRIDGLTRRVPAVPCEHIAYCMVHPKLCEMEARNNMSDVIYFHRRGSSIARSAVLAAVSFYDLVPKRLLANMRLLDDALSAGVYIARMALRERRFVHSDFYLALSRAVGVSSSTLERYARRACTLRYEIEYDGFRAISELQWMNNVLNGFVDECETFLQRDDSNWFSSANYKDNAIAIITGCDEADAKEFCTAYAPLNGVDVINDPICEVEMPLLRRTTAFYDDMVEHLGTGGNSFTHPSDILLVEDRCMVNCGFSMAHDCFLVFVQNAYLVQCYGYYPCAFTGNLVKMGCLGLWSGKDIKMRGSTVLTEVEVPRTIDVSLPFHTRYGDQRSLNSAKMSLPQLPEFVNTYNMVLKALDVLPNEIISIIVRDVFEYAGKSAYSNLLFDTVLGRYAPHMDANPEDDDEIHFADIPPELDSDDEWRNHDVELPPSDHSSDWEIVDSTVIEVVDNDDDDIENMVVSDLPELFNHRQAIIEYQAPVRDIRKDVDDVSESESEEDFG